MSQTDSLTESRAKPVSWQICFDFLLFEMLNHSLRLLQANHTTWSNTSGQSFGRTPKELSPPSSPRDQKWEFRGAFVLEERVIWIIESESLSPKINLSITALVFNYYWIALDRNSTNHFCQLQIVVVIIQTNERSEHKSLDSRGKLDRWNWLGQEILFC